MVLASPSLMLHVADTDVVCESIGPTSMNLGVVPKQRVRFFLSPLKSSTSR